MPAIARGVARRSQTILVAAACCLLAGCMGSWAIRGTRLHYNESFSYTASQELLLNIVRMRYGEGPTFMDLPNITSQSEANVVGNGSQAAALQGVFGGDFSLKDDPTLSYSPRSGNNLLVSLLKAPKAEVLLDLSPGNDTRIFLSTFVDAVNGVRNSPSATSPASRILEDNEEFRSVIDLFTGLSNRGVVRLRVATRTTKEPTESVATSAILPADMITAAENGYHFEMEGDKASLVKTSKLMAMSIRPQDVDAPDVQEMIRLLRLEPGRTAYRVASQDDANVSLDDAPLQIAAAVVAEDIATPAPASDPTDVLPAPVPAEGEMLVAAPAETTDTILLEMRSGYQVMSFLAKGVDIPASHARRGTAPAFAALDGRPFDARRLTRGLFHVCVQKTRPLHSDLAVHYRGHWFFIPADDVKSRATLSWVKLAIDLQSQAESNGPVLTLPLN